MDAVLPLNRLSAPLRRTNAVLRARSRTHFVKEFAGPLSIKSVTEGAVAWKCAGRDRLVDRDSFLVLNADEPYSMAIDSRTPVSTLCVFFQDGFVESVQAALAGKEIESECAPLPFLGGLHRRDDGILPRMQAIAQAPAGDRLCLDEQFLLLARDLLCLNGEMRRRVQSMPAVRPATRAELFRRVRRAQEYLHASACDDPSLDAIARQACLSPYHFHRAFTRAFGETPHAYRNRLRLERAHRLLAAGGMTITQVCGAVGFESAASFSTLFRKAYGAPPSAYRVGAPRR
ncbi:MAG TPA: AraC family transcriptional regulator [Bryobacteraceae bacterium]|jgi:AraC-like DNA-binding protein|nr:AraC family transcriptional regulator [Bryobacteraceae bacterium]